MGSQKPLRIGVFHPGTQHSYHTAEELQRAGVLAWHATEIFTNPERFPYSLHRYLPGRLRRGVARELQRRFAPQLRPELVRTFGFWEYLETIARRLRLYRWARWLNAHGNVVFGRRIGRLLQKEPVDVIWGFNTSSLEAFAAARPRGVGCVLEQTTPGAAFRAEIIRQEAEVTPPEWPVPPPPQEADIAREEKEWELSDLIIVGSDFVRQTIPAHYQSKVCVCPYGVDIARFQPPAGRRSEGPPTILYVGAISALKGVRYLLEACARLHRTTSFKVRLVGRLEASPAALAPYADFVVHTPHVPYAQIQRVYQEADIFVQPSLYEGLSRVVLEAAASGLPVVATAHTGVTSVLEAEEACFVVPIRGIEALAEALHSLLVEATRRTEMGRKARQQAEQYTWERYGQQALRAVYARFGRD